MSEIRTSQHAGSSRAERNKPEGKVNKYREKWFFLSKKWWMAGAGVAIPPLNMHLGWDMAPWMILPVCAYIVAQGLADMGKNRK